MSEQLDRIEVMLLEIRSYTRDRDREVAINDAASDMLSALLTLVKMYVRPSFIACITPSPRGPSATKASNAKAKKCECWKAWDAAVAAIEKANKRKRL